MIVNAGDKLLRNLKNITPPSLPDILPKSLFAAPSALKNESNEEATKVIDLTFAPELAANVKKKTDELKFRRNKEKNHVFDTGKTVWQCIRNGIKIGWQCEMRDFTWTNGIIHRDICDGKSTTNSRHIGPHFMIKGHVEKKSSTRMVNADNHFFITRT